MKDIGTVYALRNNKTGKLYVGSTLDLNTRIETHISKLRNHSHASERLQQDHDRYGDDYTVFVLYQGNVIGQDLKRIEQTFMSLLHTRNPERGYNDKDPSSEFCLSKCSQVKIPQEGIRREVNSLAPKEKQMAHMRVICMAENEKKLVESVAALPEPLRAEFLSQIQGAATAVKVLTEQPSAKDAKDSG